MTACNEGHAIEGDNAYTDPTGRAHCKTCRARRDRDAYQLRKATRTKTEPIGSQHKRTESGGVRLPTVMEAVRQPYPWERDAVTTLITRRYPDDADWMLQCLGLVDYKRNAAGMKHK